MEPSNPYRPPSARVDNKPTPPRLLNSERVLLILLIVNAFVGSALVLSNLVLTRGALSLAAVPNVLLSLLGFVSAAVMRRKPYLGLVLGAVFYFPQTFSCFSSSLSWGVRAGLFFVLSAKVGSAMLFFNVVAIALLILHIAMAAQRFRSHHVNETVA